MVYRASVFSNCAQARKPAPRSSPSCKTVRALAHFRRAKPLALSLPPALRLVYIVASGIGYYPCLPTHALAISRGGASSLTLFRQ